jgi:WD40 repeat protein
MLSAPLALPASQRTVFLSYGHDCHAGLARQLAEDLRRRGHTVWFDESLRSGDDWEYRIEQGLQQAAAGLDRGRFVLLMTPHAVRRPDGYCLNELASALRRGLRVLPVMVEDCEPPLSICRLQYLDLRDCVPWPERGERYADRFEQLRAALEEDRLDLEGTQARLQHYLRPLEFDADFDRHLPRFTGRRWVFDQLDTWLAEPRSSRVFWITAAPGVGKTALVTWLCAKRPDVAAFHLCRHGDAYKTDPRRIVCSLVYQLASQLPDYATRLNGAALEELAVDASARTLFDALLTQPLSKGYAAPKRPVLVVIDALDEATRDGHNELAELLGSEWGGTPPWLRLVLTSRPEREVSFPLQALTPYVLDAAAPENRQDIRVYLSRELRPFNHGVEVPAAVLDAVEARSEGFFLYAEWVRAELAEGRLSLEHVDRFPQGLGGVYAAFFTRQFPDVRTYEEQIRPALQVIAAAREPLEVPLLESLLDWSEYDRRELVGRLGALFPVSGNKILAFHKSALDWLTSEEKAGPYWVDVREGKRRIIKRGWRLYRLGVQGLPGYLLRHLSAHLLEAKPLDALVEVLLDWRYLEAKAEAGLVFELAADFTAVLSRIGEAEPRRQLLRLIEQALRMDLHFLDRHPACLFQCLWNSGWWYDCAEAEKHYESPESGWHGEGPPWRHSGLKLSAWLEEWRGQKEEATPGFRWARSLRPPPIPLGGAQIAVFRGHEGPVSALASSPDGRCLASAGDRTVRVWNAESGVQLLCLRGPERNVSSLAYAPDGRRLAVGWQDGTLCIWDAADRERPLFFRGHANWVSDVAFSSDGQHLASASWDHTVRVWDSRSGTQLLCLRHEGDEDSPGETESRADRPLPTILVGGTGCVYSVAFSPDGRRLASGDKVVLRGAVRIWDAQSGARILCLRGHEGGVTGLAYSPDGKRLASASDDGTVRVWDVRTGAQLLCLEHRHYVNRVVFSPDGRRLAAGCEDQTVLVWDSFSGALLQCNRASGGPVKSVVYVLDGRRLASGSSDGTVCVWDAQGVGQLPHLRGHETHVWDPAFSADGNYLASGSDDGTLCIWNVRTGTELRRLRASGETWPVQSVALSRDGQCLAAGSPNGTVRVWDVVRGTLLCCVGGSGHCMSFSPDGRHLAEGFFDGILRVWEAQSGAEFLCLSGHQRGIACLAYSPDGRHLAAGTFDGTVHVWDAQIGVEILRLRGHESSPVGVAYTLDGCRLAVWGWEYVWVWDAHSGQRLETRRVSPAGNLSAVDAYSGDAVDLEVSFRFEEQQEPVVQRELHAVLGPDRFAWIAIRMGWETVIQSALTGESRAWFPSAFQRITPHPKSRMWAGTVANHLYLIALEGG